MSDTQSASAVTGRRHERTDGRECFCGCQSVVGLAGRVVEDSDTPKLLSLERPMVIATFDVPCPAGGPARPEQVAYYVDELS